MSVSRGNCNLSSIEKPTVMVTNFPAIAFTLRISTKARLLNKSYSEHLEKNEHKSVEDLHEDIYFLRNTVAAQVEQTAQVLSGQCRREESAGELRRFGNSVLLEESNDELLDQAWDDHTGESSDAKKVK